MSRGAQHRLWRAINRPEYNRDLLQRGDGDLLAAGGRRLDVVLLRRAQRAVWVCRRPSAMKHCGPA